MGLEELPELCIGPGRGRSGDIEAERGHEGRHRGEEHRGPSSPTARRSCGGEPSHHPSGQNGAEDDSGGEVSHELLIGAARQNDEHDDVGHQRHDQKIIEAPGPGTTLRRRRPAHQPQHEGSQCPDDPRHHDEQTQDVHGLERCGNATAGETGIAHTEHVGSPRGHPPQVSQHLGCRGLGMTGGHGEGPHRGGNRTNDPRDDQAGAGRAQRGYAGAPAPGAEHGNHSRRAGGNDAQRDHQEVPESTRSEEAHGHDPTPSHTPRSQSGEGDETPQRRPDMQRASKEEQRQDMAGETEQDQHRGGGGEAGHSPAPVTCEPCAHEDHRRADHGRDQLKKHATHSGDEFDDHVEGRVDRPERVQGQCPTVEHHVAAGHRLTFEDRGCTVGVPGHVVHGRGVEERDQRRESCQADHHDEDASSSSLPQIRGRDRWRKRRGPDLGRRHLTDDLRHRRDHRSDASWRNGSDCSTRSPVLRQGTGTEALRVSDHLWNRPCPTPVDASPPRDRHT